VLFREVQVNNGFFQIFMAEQKLNGAQICTGLEQMRGKTVAKQMGIDAFSDTRSLGGLLTRVPSRFRSDRLITAAAAVA
jgi:hypothetical protein